jgi:hypothetical protein
MKGNFCTVEMMIFLPSCRNLAQLLCLGNPVALVHGADDRLETCAKRLMCLADLLVEVAAVGDDDDRIEDRRLGGALSNTSFFEKLGCWVPTPPAPT